MNTSVLPFILETEVFAAEFKLNSFQENLDFNSFRLPAGHSLTDLIPHRKYERIRRILYRTSGIDLDYFQHTLPIVTSNFIAEGFIGKSDGPALDEYLWNLAEKSGKEMQGIETFSEQLETLRRIPVSVQLKILTESMRKVDKLRNSSNQLLHCYPNGDIQQLFRLVKKNARGLRKILLYKRNEIMAERIAQLITRKTAFIAIGAGHLAGGKGVIRLLKHANIRVSPMKMGISRKGIYFNDSEIPTPTAGEEKGLP